MRHSLSKRLSVPHYLRACLHGGGVPQVGEVTRLAVVEKIKRVYMQSYNLRCWGEVS